MYKILIAVLFVGLSAFGKSETVEGAKKDYENFKKEMSVKLDAAEKELKDLRAKAQQKGSKVQEKTIREMEQTRDRLRKDLDALGEKSKSTWSELKKDLAASMNSLNDRIQKALKDEEEKESHEGHHH